MTILTPTSNPPAGGATPSPGVPVESLLARLANEMFAALPGAVGSALGLVAVPSTSAAPAAAGFAAPSRAAMPPAPWGLPSDEELSRLLVALDGSPARAGAAPSTPGGHFYFIDPA